MPTSPALAARSLRKRARSPVSPKHHHTRSTVVNQLQIDDTDSEPSSEDEEGWESEPDSESEDSDNEEDHTEEPNKRPATSSNPVRSTSSKKGKKNFQDAAAIEVLNNDLKLLRVENYNEVSENWTDRYIDQLLAYRKDVVNNTPPPKVLAEAEAVQALGRRQRKLLCLVGHISVRTLETAL